MMRAVNTYYEKFPGHIGQVSFVEYAGESLLNVYLLSKAKIVYDLNLDMVKCVLLDVDYVDAYLKEHPVKTEADYRDVFSYLLMGRLDALRMSIDYLAEKSNISRQTIHRILAKQVTPSSYTAYILEKNLQNSENDIWRFI